MPTRRSLSAFLRWAVPTLLLCGEAAAAEPAPQPLWPEVPPTLLSPEDLDFLAPILNAPRTLGEAVTRANEPPLLAPRLVPATGATWEDPAGLPPAPGSLSAQADTPWLGSLSSRLVIVAPPANPELPPSGGGWQTEEAWRLPFLGPVFLFGQVGADCASGSIQEMKVITRTGVGWKLPTWPCGEMNVRGGPVITWADPLGLEQPQDQQSEWQLEVQCRWPLPWQVNLEYLGAAFSTVGPTMAERLNQDVRFAFPLGTAGQFHLGARHNWEGLTVPPSWVEQMQLYVGLQLKR